MSNLATLRAIWRTLDDLTHGQPSPDPAAIAAEIDALLLHERLPARQEWLGLVVLQRLSPEYWRDWSARFRCAEEYGVTLDAYPYALDGRVPAPERAAGERWADKLLDVLRRREIDRARYGETPPPPPYGRGFDLIYHN